MTDRESCGIEFKLALPRASVGKRQMERRTAAWNDAISSLSEGSLN